MLNLKLNDTLEAQPLIVRLINKKSGQNNREYYHLQLSHGLQNLDGKIWNGDPAVAENITPGCIARVWAVVKDFKGTLQLHISKIERIDNPDEEIVDEITPACQFEQTHLMEEIQSIVDSVKTPELHELLTIIFNEPHIKENFYKTAAGAEIHHAYLGGLAHHTIEVAKTAIHFCSFYKAINYDIAVTAALIHDIGKTYELSNFPENKYTDKGRLLGHIAMGCEILQDAANQIEDFPLDLRLDLEHCILSHHGTMEMGSPVVPMTLEAIVLHNADKASADINGFFLAIQRDMNAGRWTDYNNTYKRFIKKN